MGLAVPRLLALCLLVSLLPRPGWAWTPETRVSMADEAVRLMPPSLRIALEAHRADLLRGLLPPLTEDGPDRRAPWAGGTLDQALAAQARTLAQLLEKPTAFPELAERFGTLAHYVLEAGFPPGVSSTDGEERYAHFADFCQSRRERFPLVFYGHDDEALEQADYRAFALEIMRRADREDRELARAYRAAGDPPDPAAFDDRSVPFAVGSLAYSRSVGDLVRLWLRLWDQAGGDTQRTPFRKSPETTQNQRRP
jgi:hypothetical protein